MISPLDKYCIKCDIIYTHTPRMECPVCKTPFTKHNITKERKVDTAVKENEAFGLIKELKSKNFTVKEVCKILSRAYTMMLAEKKEIEA